MTSPPVTPRPPVGRLFNSGLHNSRLKGCAGAFC